MKKRNILAGIASIASGVVTTAAGYAL